MMKISIVIPMYNDAPFLPATLDSLLAQTMGDFEIIAVDDASTDGTAIVAARYAERDNRIRLIRHEKNANSFQTRLTGLEQVRGDYVFCCDADDVIPPAALAQFLSKAEQTGADVVQGRMIYTDSSSGVEPRGTAYFFEPFRRAATGGDFVLAMLRNTRGWSVVNKLFTRRTVERALPVFPRGRRWFSMDDMLASCLLGLHAEGYAALDEVTYFYRLPPVTHAVRAGGFEKWANDNLGIMAFLEETVAARQGEGPLLEGVRGCMRNCITGLLSATSAQSPESFGIVSEKVREIASPAHVRWAEEQGLFDIASMKRKQKGKLGKLCSLFSHARDRGLREAYLRLRIKLRARRMEREYKAAQAATPQKENA